MSYELIKHRDNTVRWYDHWLYSLVGKGEHEGTILTMPQERIFAHKFASEGELAAFLDRQFLLAHSDRLAAASGMETRQGGDSEAAPSRSDDSPTAESGDAQTQSPSTPDNKDKPNA